MTKVKDIKKTNKKVSKKSSKNNSFKGSRKVGKVSKKNSRKTRSKKKSKRKNNKKSNKDLSTTEEFCQLLDEDVSEQQPPLENRRMQSSLGFENFGVQQQQNYEEGVQVDPQISPFSNQALGKEFNYDFGDLYERHQQNMNQEQHSNQTFIPQEQGQMMGQQQPMMSPQMMGQQPMMSPQMMGQQPMSPQMMGQQAMSPQISGVEQMPGQGSDLSSLFSSLGNMSNSNILV